MERRIILLLIPVALLITLALSFVLTDLGNKITGKATNVYFKDLELEECSDAGFWDMDYQNFKLTECPDSRPIMMGVGIGVNHDTQASGRAYCCKAKDVEVYDCIETEKWEEDSQDYKITKCPLERPIMKGIGIKVKNGNQAGGKVLCCKAKKVEIENCAVTGYWKKSNKDNKLTFCPEDKPVMGGVGFNIQDDNQAGGEVYCCKFEVEMKSGAEIVEEIPSPEIEVVEEAEEVEEEVKKEESFGRLFVKFFCKIFTQSEENYQNCIGS